MPDQVGHDEKQGKKQVMQGKKQVGRQKKPVAGPAFISDREKLFLAGEIILGLVGLDELLRENVSTGLRGLLHADALDHALGTGLGREGCNCFLCHILISC